MTDKPEKCLECGYAMAVHGNPELHLPCSRDRATKGEMALKNPTTSSEARH